MGDGSGPSESWEEDAMAMPEMLKHLWGINKNNTPLQASPQSTNSGPVKNPEAAPWSVSKGVEAEVKGRRRRRKNKEVAEVGEPIDHRSRAQQQMLSTIKQFRFGLNIWKVTYSPMHTAIERRYSTGGDVCEIPHYKNLLLIFLSGITCEISGDFSKRFALPSYYLLICSLTITSMVSRAVVRAFERKLFRSGNNGGGSETIRAMGYFRSPAAPRSGL